MIVRPDERPKTIIIQSRVMYRSEGRAKADADIMPGMLVEVDTQEDIPRIPPVVKKHATSGGPARRLIALEAFKQGLGLGDVIPDGDIVEMHECQPGDIVLVRVADDFTAVPGTKLKSGGAGTLIAHGGTGTALFEVADDVDYNTLDLSDYDEDDPRAQPLVRAIAL